MSKTPIYGLLVVFVSLFAFGLFTVTYVGHAIRESNAPLCALVVTITEPRPVPPQKPDTGNTPTTPAGKDLQEYQKALDKYNQDTAEYNKRVSANLKDLSNKNC
jgi:hypothetical protein